MASGLLLSQTRIFRGATVQFRTTFYDADKNVINPSSASVEVDYPDLNGNRQQLAIAMVLTLPQTFIGVLDTRNMGVGTVYWSVHSVPPIPSAVEDGSFELTANPANLQTF